MIYIGQCWLYYVGAQYLLSVFTEPDYLQWFKIGQCLLYYVGAQYLLSVFTEHDYLLWFTLVNAYYLLSVFNEPFIYPDLQW